jgi:SNF2 family DNA or RNA helicase
VQNNLQEFFALLSFIAPELLGTPQTFKRVRTVYLVLPQFATILL